MKKLYASIATLLLIANSMLAQNNPGHKLVKVPPLTSDFTLDGKLDEADWNGIVNNKLTNFINSFVTSRYKVGSVWPKGNDNDVNFGVLWDSDNLYIGIKVIDDVVLSGKKNKEGIHIYMDMDNIRCESDTGGPAGRAYSPTDMEFVLMHDSVMWSPQPYYDQNTDFLFAQSDFPGGYSYEFVLPWDQLDFFFSSSTRPEVKAGRLIGIDVSNDDADSVETVRDGQLMWNQCCNNRNWSETFAFGTLELSDEAVAGTKAADEKDLIKVQPNPSKDYFDISVSNGAVVVHAELSTISGKVVYSSDNAERVITAGLPAGLYFLQIKTTTGVMTEKIMVE